MNDNKPLIIDYFENVVLAFSKLLRALLGGDGIETLSQATEKGYRSGKWWCVFLLRPLINTLFLVFRGERNHTSKSLDSDGTTGLMIWDWSD